MFGVIITREDNENIRSPTTKDSGPITNTRKVGSTTYKKCEIRNLSNKQRKYDKRSLPISLPRCMSHQ